MAQHKVTFKPGDVVVQVDPAKYPCSGTGEPGSLLDIALANGVEFEHACGGAGVCGTCHVIIESGMENLSPAGEDELDTVEQAPGNSPQSRLACQAVVAGDVVVSVPSWNRNAGKERG